MKCNNVLHSLLATSGPRRLSADVLAHLDGCDSCRRVGERLRQIDQAVPALPVPDSRPAREALVARFLAPPVPSAGRAWFSGLRWAHFAAAAAAAVLLMVVVRGVFTGGGQGSSAPPQDRLLANVLKRNVELAAADKPEQRVDVLGGLADDLDAEARTLADVASEEEMKVLADLYVSVVAGESGLVRRADELVGPQVEKKLQQLVDHLGKVAQAVDVKSREVPPAATASLQLIARTARDARSTLSKKLVAQQAAKVRWREETLAQEEPPRAGEGKS